MPPRKRKRGLKAKGVFAAAEAEANEAADQKVASHTSGRVRAGVAPKFLKVGGSKKAASAAAGAAHYTAACPGPAPG